MKRLLSALLVLAALFAFCACGQVEAEPKTFTKENMTITLTDAFKEASVEGYTVGYESKKVAVIALREAFSLMQGFESWTLDQYAEVIHANAAANSPTQISHSDGLTSFEYSFFNADEDQTYTYFVAMYKCSDAFWTISFASIESDYEGYRASFVEWAKSVAFAN